MRAVLLLTALLLVPTPGASAQVATGTIERAADELRSDNVYVDPDAELADEVDAGELRQRITDRGAGPMYIAVLPQSALDEAGGDPDTVIRQLAQAVGRNATYAAVIGSSRFRAGGPSGTGDAGRAAVEAHGNEGAQAVLLAFIDNVASGDAGGDPTGPDGDGGGTAALLLLGAGAIGGGALLVRRRRRRREEAAEFAEVKENARDDLVALGEDIRALDLDVELASGEAKEAYGRAVDAYDRADTAWERARRPEDLEPVAAALEEGRYEMSVSKAMLNGQTPPERRPPCFFDPRHGPSDRDVEWAPPGGAPRVVPACEADAQRVERGEDPEAREVMVGGQRMPYWNAGPMYAPFAGGFFGGFGGGLLPGLAMGTLLGSALGGGWGVPVAYGDDFGGGDFDVGGGDFDMGGGDFGGGDFGGGDFGGGDFGGGDF